MLAAAACGDGVAVDGDDLDWLGCSVDEVLQVEDGVGAGVGYAP